MARRPIRNHGAGYKAKVALEALNGEEGPEVKELLTGQTNIEKKQGQRKYNV